MVSGKISLVTGGASGIGRATCQLLASQGSTVVVADINTEGAEETVKSLKGTGHIAVMLDVTDVKGVEDAVRSIKEHFREPPRICVNCAGIAIHSGVLQNDDAVYNRIMDVNVKGTMNVTKQVCKELRELELTGSIINVTSVSMRGMENLSVYGGSKGAVASYTKAVGREFGRFGIRCNAVCPGTILTPMLENAPRDNARAFIRCIAMRRVGKPEEVAEVIAFLASEKASYVTSINMYVDGGLGVPG